MINLGSLICLAKAGVSSLSSKAINAPVDAAVWSDQRHQKTGSCPKIGLHYLSQTSVSFVFKKADNFKNYQPFKLGKELVI